MIRQQFFIPHQGLHGVKECAQRLRITQIRAFLSQLTIHLRQRGCAEGITAFPQIHQQQTVRHITPQLRRDGPAHIIHTGKCRDHQRQRRCHLALFALLVPAGFHRHGIFTDRDRQAERRA